MSIRRVLLGLGAALALAAPSRAETLADALAEAYESSGLLEQNRAVLRAADEDVAQAVSALRPVVSWVGSFSASNPRRTVTTSAPVVDPVTGDVSVVDTTINASTFGVGSVFDLSYALGLQASVTLYDAGQRRLLLDQQKELVLATRQALLDVEQQVLFRVVQAYLEVQRAESFVELRQNNVRVITQELRAAQDRFEVGEVTRTDVALAEARLAAARSQLSAEQGSLERAREEFRAAVGSPPEDLAPAPIARIPFSQEEARAVALRTFPVLLQAQHQVAAAEIGVAAARTTLEPTVTGSAQTQLTQDLDRTAGLSLQVTGPIYQGGRLASVIRQAQAGRDQARAALLTASRTVEQNVAIAFANLDVARASIEAFQRQVEASSIAFEGVREEATLGARTTLDVLDAEQELLNARANLVSAQVDQTVASYQLLVALGLMTAQNLGLAVQVYDPTAYYNLVDDAPAARSERGEALDRVLESISR